MEKSTKSQNNPYKVKVEKGKIYFWCSCGLFENSLFVMENINMKENLNL